MRPIAAKFNARVLAFLVASLLLGVVALVRVISEKYSGKFDGTPLAFIQRVPYDGTWWSYVNVQWFKILYVPAVASFTYVVIYLMICLRVPMSEGTLAERRGQWHFKPKTILRCAVLAFALSVAIELLKHLGIGNLAMLSGESFYLNQLVHTISAVLGYFYMRVLPFGQVARD